MVPSGGGRARRRALASASGPILLAALVAAGGARAQSGGEVSEVIVTGSRVITNGNAAPTPLTVVSTEQLRTAAPTTLSDGLNQLPQFAGSSRPQTAGPAANGNNGGNYLSLRSLGPSRTLVLLNGRRAPPSNTSGAANVNLFPQALVQRVDIVTGGASAAYGSDAVAGVVNFVLDEKYQGIKGEVSGGVSRYGDAESFKANVAFGTELFGGRGHLLASLDHTLQGGWAASGDPRGRKWMSRGRAIIANPASPPQMLLIREGAGIVTGAFGGLIISGPLAGTQFDANGNPGPFNFGSLRTTTTAVNGDGAYLTSAQPGKNRSDLAFVHLSYDVTDKVTAFGEVSWGEELTGYISTIPSEAGAANAFTIFRDNPYLPASIRTEMTNRNLQSILVGRLSADWGLPHFVNLSNDWSFLGGLKGEIGKWSFDAYAQHNISFFKTRTVENSILQNTYNAADAAINPTTGAIVCRSTLTNPNDGCVPVNIFGVRKLTDAQYRYLLGTSWSRQTLKADVLAARISGELFEGWAGPISVATGVEYRTYDIEQVVDPLSTYTISGANFRGLPSNYQGQVGGYQLTNSKPSKGSYNVKEAFAEVIVPLLSDAPLAKSLDLNASVRRADYSTIGGVTPWKVGASWSLNDQIRLRGTISRDIRAGNFVELYSGTIQGQGFVNDPNFGNTQQFLKSLRVGNPDLVPESSDTKTLGVVVQPGFLPGTSLAVDWFSLDIKDAISLLSTQEVLNACAAGVAEQCRLVDRDAAGRLISITTPYQNAAAFKVRGVDIEAGYRTEFAGGQLSVRGLATYTGKLTTRVGSAGAIDRAGDLGRSNGGVPKWRANLIASYNAERFGGTLQVRYLGDGKLDNTYTPARIDVNHVPSVVYVDLTIKYDVDLVGSKSTLFATINNLFDKDPPPVPGMSSVTFYPTNYQLYDAYGRYYTVGLRFRY